MVQYNHNYQRFPLLKRFFLQAPFLFLIDAIFQVTQKHHVKLQPSVKDDTVYYLSTMKANG